jgi:hypothetical protein
LGYGGALHYPPVRAVIARAHAHGVDNNVLSRFADIAGLNKTPSNFGETSPQLLKDHYARSNVRIRSLCEHKIEFGQKTLRALEKFTRGIGVQSLSKLVENKYPIHIDIQRLDPLLPMSMSDILTGLCIDSDVLSTQLLTNMEKDLRRDLDKKVLPKTIKSKSTADPWYPTDDLIDWINEYLKDDDE